MRYLFAAGLAFALMGALITQPEAQSGTCSAANTKCKAACKDAVASPQCPSYCANGFSKCKQTGCFPKAPRFGGGETCGLAKS